ncbi:thioesterase [Caballeronia sordidicola]|uniref:Thioesterase n=1 Tax=Caballeronia sordidicola TaxID=196367 RepID=A0A158HLA6_CABSO|nr:alpha/beta fold hydrolase [Caballeronia sordidicola]SAL45165.1 thioesterase [Caballeronia sordidicola]
MSLKAIAVDSVTPPVELICLAHAGGAAASYRQWQAALPRGVRVFAPDYAGHGLRRTQPPHRAWTPLIEDLVDEVAARLDRNAPFAVFGHSMGALAGFELCHALRARDGREPLWFGASASVAPERRTVESHWLGCPRETMAAKLAALGGTPAALLDDADFLDLVLPVLRADFHLCGVYIAHLRAGSPRVPLACPLDVFTGRGDAATACTADVAAWRDYTRGPFAQHAFDGGHFYLDMHVTPLLRHIGAALASCASHPLAQGLVT